MSSPDGWAHTVPADPRANPSAPAPERSERQPFRIGSDLLPAPNLTYSISHEAPLSGSQSRARFLVLRGLKLPAAAGQIPPADPPVASMALFDAISSSEFFKKALTGALGQLTSAVPLLVWILTCGCGTDLNRSGGTLRLRVIQYHGTGASIPQFWRVCVDLHCEGWYGVQRFGMASPDLETVVSPFCAGS